MSTLYKKIHILILLITLVSIPQFSSAQSSYNDFELLVEFVGQNGNESTLRRSICKCDKIYLKNKSVSTSNNFPIGNGLTTGTYRVTSSNNVLIANIPASSWPYDGVQAIQICGDFSGASINLYVRHHGPGINSGNRQRGVYLNTYQTTVNAGPDVNICQGTNVQLSGSGADSYSWSPATGLSDSNIATPDVSLMESQGYTLSGTKTFNTTIGSPSSLTCTDTDAIQINVENLYTCDPGRKGMTWQKNEIEPVAGLVSVGCGNGLDKCDPRQGDRVCTDALPMLCFNPTNFKKPTSNDFFPADWFATPSQYHQWSGGVVATTRPVSPQSWNFDTIDKADEFCERTFGDGWRVAEFHDGRHWNFWAYGNTNDNFRFWTNINDQKNGNCWIGPN